MAKILDVKIDNLTFPEVMAKITLFLEGKKLHQIATVNPEFILAAQRDSEFKAILNQADLSVPDGVGLKFGGWLSGQKIGERLTGVDLTWELTKLSAYKNYSIYFLGAATGVAEKAAKRMKMLYPNLKIAGCYAGTPEDPKTLDNIKKAKPDILLVAFGAPKQDKFIYNLKNNYSDFGFQISDLPKVAMGVGGTFDYISGAVPRAPKWLRNLGLEWLYRLVHQPKRIGRIFKAVIVFPIRVIFRS
ncbi:MAG: WecB/TagA/CpsF family glycosyltransferase [Patescibacteria group bacterium]|nr:WecB/TagA/CpsF family glycosyltransferase [Patescibacteria group bacterium]